MLKAVRRFLLFGLAIICAHAVVAQNETHSPRFALEISSSGKLAPYSIVPEQGESSTFMTGAEIYAEQSAGKAPEARPSALKLSYKVQKDAVALSVSVLFGNLNVNDTPTSLRDVPEKLVGAFSLRINDSVLLRELEPFGLRPLSVKVVWAVSEAPVAAHILSKAPSIRVEMGPQDRTGYRVALHNGSSQPVVQYAISGSMKDDSGASRIVSSYGIKNPAIAPGGTREESVFCNHAVDPSPCDFVLQTVVFADGSYEGDTNMAALLEARRLGTDLQRRRVQEIISNNSKDRATGDTAGAEHRTVALTVARIREQLTLLPVDLDDEIKETILQKIRSDFPVVGESSNLRARALNETRSELQGVKQSALRSLNDYEAYSQSLSHGSKLSLSEWVANGMTMGITSKK